MNKEIEPLIINSIVYFESRYIDTLLFSNDIQKCIDKLKTNDVYCSYSIIDSFISWMNDDNYQYKLKLNIKIMPFINIDNYYRNKHNPNYSLKHLNQFLKSFLLMFFSTNNLAPYYFEDTFTNTQIQIDDMYLYSEELAKCDQQYLYNYLMSNEFINICSKYYHDNNSIYEPIIEKLIDEHSISLNDYINNSKTHKLGDRKVILLE